MRRFLWVVIILLSGRRCRCKHNNGGVRYMDARYFHVHAVRLIVRCVKMQRSEQTFSGKSCHVKSKRIEETGEVL